MFPYFLRCGVGQGPSLPYNSRSKETHLVLFMLGVTNTWSSVLALACLHAACVGNRSEKKHDTTATQTSMHTILYYCYAYWHTLVNYSSEGPFIQRCRTPPESPGPCRAPGTFQRMRRLGVFQIHRHCRTEQALLNEGPQLLLYLFTLGVRRPATHTLKANWRFQNPRPVRETRSGS